MSHGTKTDRVLCICVTASEAATRPITLPAYSMSSQRTFNSYYTALGLAVSARDGTACYAHELRLSC